MPIGSVNPIDIPDGQYVYNYTHARKPLCAVSNGYMALGSGQLNGRKDRCEVIRVSLRKHGVHFLPRIPIHLTGNPLGLYSGLNVIVLHKSGRSYESVISAHTWESSRLMSVKHLQSTYCSLECRVRVSIGSDQENQIFILDLFSLIKSKI
ncbi:hypothetical protein AVEN_127442-1 [Araneus ventricosus]|uniref:Uncharacterized protein n=1 Tax=Araneus ventricosus TaxID=182803 RepID=A0A4Y2ETH6_ARAVE|nr:hypothetical protein AVEN_127442-1 [Araneus ventricosus]